MRGFKLDLEMPDGSRVWVNGPQILKMVKTVDDRYFLYLVNGEMYEISRRMASTVEDYFED